MTAGMEISRFHDRGTVFLRLFEACRADEWHTMFSIMELAGYTNRGNSLYAVAMRELVSGGWFETRSVQTGGRPRKEYRRAREMYYNTEKDKRMTYHEWDELSPVDQADAKVRFAGEYPWLDWEDWLYPMTRGTSWGYPRRLAMGTRVLNIPLGIAEGKREAWRNKSGMLVR